MKNQNFQEIKRFDAFKSFLLFEWPELVSAAK